MKLSAIFPLAIILLGSETIAGPSLFPPLANETPIADFASKTKAMVTDQGSVELLLYSPDPGSKTKEGPRLSISLAGHPVGKASISQRYTADVTPVVQTDSQWSDMQLSLRAFAAEPRAAGFYVTGELLGKGSHEKQFTLEVRLENVSGGHILEKSAYVDDRGHLILHMVPVAGGAASKEQPTTATLQPAPSLGVAFDIPVTLDSSGKFAFALQMPVDDS
jgi:hypothetical protein